MRNDVNETTLISVSEVDAGTSTTYNAEQSAKAAMREASSAIQK